VEICDDDLRAIHVVKHVIWNQFTTGVVAVRIVGLKHAEAVFDCQAGRTNQKAARKVFAIWATHRIDGLPGYLERFDIPPHSKIRFLSKGQSIKLGLAVALAHRPPIVILDDPAMGLDPIARKELNRDLVEHLQTSGCTVLYSSHLLGEVEAVADAVAILDQGKILRTGTTDQLREEVKRIILPMAAVSGISKPEGLLDVRRHEHQLVFVTDHAGTYTQQLAARGINHEVVELSLDEIFEVFVIGRTVDWPDKAARPAAVSV